MTKMNLSSCNDFTSYSESNKSGQIWRNLTSDFRENSILCVVTKVIFQTHILLTGKMAHTTEDHRHLIFRNLICKKFLKYV